MQQVLAVRASPVAPALASVLALAPQASAVDPVRVQAVVDIPALLLQAMVPVLVWEVVPPLLPMVLAPARV